MTHPPEVSGTLVLDLPFTGSWRAINSPARRVPSHGTDAFGSAHAIDFVPVDEHGRSVPRSWRNVAATIPPERFVGFGAPILAPVSGVVVAVHDGEPDHDGRISRLRLIPYLLTQRERARLGVSGLAGNHIVLAVGAGIGMCAGPGIDTRGPYVVLAHLRRGSIGARVGDSVRAGQRVAECGNSGNSTEPHLHVQMSDSLDFARARGVPVRFRDRTGTVFLPAEREIVAG